MRLPPIAFVSILLTLAAAELASAQSSPQPKWPDIERETLEHFQAILRLDTRNPPGNETRAAQYLKSVFDREGIPAEFLALDIVQRSLGASVAIGTTPGCRGIGRRNKR